ncbi:MAG: hypothetical protein ACJAYJ_001586 [Saprospiraceae bacterium]|jgi:hypothetical protein
MLFAQQDWPVVGAKWVQNEEHYYDPMYEYYILECTGDTVINNVNYRVVSDPYYSSYYFIHQDEEKFYLLLEDSLRLIYDFGVATGDSVIFELLNRDATPEIIPIDYVVDSVTQIVINGIELKKVYSHESGFDNDDFHQYNYTERMGYTRKIIQDRATLTNVPEADFSWLRCYMDDEIEFYSQKFEGSGLDDCFATMLPNATDEEFLDSEISIFQNPVLEVLDLSVNFDISKTLDYQIFDAIGNNITAGKIAIWNGITTINVSDFSKGMYFLYVFNEEKKKSLKFVKN